QLIGRQYRGPTITAGPSKSHHPSRTLGRRTQRCTPVALSETTISPLTLIAGAVKSGDTSAVGPAVSNLALIAVAIGEGVDASAVELAVAEVTLVAAAVRECENA